MKYLLLAALVLAGCSSAGAPTTPLDISGTYSLDMYWTSSLPARWLPDQQMPSSLGFSAAESHIESGTITITPTATGGVYNFTKLDSFPDYRLSPISRIRTTFTTTGTVSVGPNGKLAFTIATGLEAGKTVGGGSGSQGVYLGVYDYVRR